MEWEGPVPCIDIDEDNTVTVQQTDDVLSTDQKADLDTLINPGLSMSEDLLINQFTTAKIFVHSHS